VGARVERPPVARMLVVIEDLILIQLARARHLAEHLVDLVETGHEAISVLGVVV
jgi:hypothetical protein